MSDANYPLPAFYFALRVLGKSGIDVPQVDADASFQEISGIEAERDTEPVAEGEKTGSCTGFRSRCVTRNLVLKRGVTNANSFLSEWIGKSLASNLVSRVADARPDGDTAERAGAACRALDVLKCLSGQVRRPPL